MSCPKRLGCEDTTNCRVQIGRWQSGHRPQALIGGCRDKRDRERSGAYQVPGTPRMRSLPTLSLREEEGNPPWPLLLCLGDDNGAR